MSGWLNHLIVAPVLLPLLAASAMLLLDERQRAIKAFISFVTAAAILFVNVFLLTSSIKSPLVYELGNWSAPYGIVLVADQLSAIMLVLTGLLSLFTMLFSFARWDRAGPRFHSLFMLLVMGLNGAFLTGDIFNLFVFFEVLLAASYGLALHGSGNARIKAGVHYIAVNLVASALFLIGASLIYGTIGTLNMADIAVNAAAIRTEDQALFNIGIAMLGIAFLIKAGMWPLGFWLPATYSAASAPVAAVFAIMSKVGIYAVLRLASLIADSDITSISGFYSSWLFAGGIATIFYGSIVVLSARTLSRMACACVFISSGTLLCALSIGTGKVLAAGLYYLMSSTLAIAAFFLLIELLNRVRGTNKAILAEPVFTDEYRDPFEDGHMDDAQNVVIIPAALALLSGGFLLCAILLAGMPPMSGFIGKFSLMTAVLAEEGNQSRTAWTFIGILTFSSLVTIVAIIRGGIEALWVPKDEPTPHIALSEFLSISGLLIACIVLTIMSGPVMERMHTTAGWLQNTANYTEVVLNKAETEHKKERAP